MSAPHAPDHEERLKAYWGGDLAADDLALELEDCAECRRKMRELSGIARVLDGAAAEERAVLEEAARAVSAPSAPELPRVPRYRRAGRLAAAAVLALFLGALWWARERELAPRERPIVLGGGAVECRAPLGTVARFDEFVWTASAPEGGWYGVLVYAERDGAQPLARAEHVEAPPWRPEREEADRWPQEIRWEVHAFDATGAEIGSCSGSASRSP